MVTKHRAHSEIGICSGGGGVWSHSFYPPYFLEKDSSTELEIARTLRQKAVPKHCACSEAGICFGMKGWRGLIPEFPTPTQIFLKRVGAQNSKLVALSCTKRVQNFALILESEFTLGGRSRKTFTPATIFFRMVESQN